MQASPGKKDNKSLRRWIVQVVVSGAVLGLIFWLLPTEDVWGAIKSVPAGLWSLVLGVFFLGHGVAAVKWWLLTNKKDDIPAGRAIRAHFAGLAANLCLPGVAGGDVLRAGLVLRGSENKTHVALGSITDRLLDVFSLLMLSAAGALFTVDSAGTSVGPLQKIAIFVLVVVVLAICAVFVIPRLPLTSSLRSISDKVSSVIKDFARQPGRLSLCLLLSIGVQAIFVQLNILLAEAAGVEIPAAAWFFAWPLAKLAAAVPISLAGLGIREASLAVLLAPLGGNSAQIVAVGLVWQTVLLVAGALSAITLTLGTKLQRSPTDEAVSLPVHDRPDNNTRKNHLA